VSGTREQTVAVPDPAVMWFRRDLRLDDHPALAAALSEHPEVVPLFVLDPVFSPSSATPRGVHLAAALRALGAATGGALVVRHGDPAEVVAEAAAEVGASTVYVSRDAGPYGRRRDAAVASRLQSEGRTLRGVGSPYAVEPGTVLKGDGTPYAVFTPFFKAWQQQGWARPVDAATDPAWIELRGDPFPEPAASGPDLPAAGPEAALERWGEFERDGLGDYADQRNIPGVDGTSRLSVHLRWGTVHPRRLLSHLDLTEPAHRTFASEIAWREFYADVLLHHPDSAWRNLRPGLDAMALDTDDRAHERFRVWCDGRTGYPIVDAGMRQLAATGWMHNRVRMIAASFLVKDLHLPWQWGARYFMDRLVDGDLASNNHGWQWVAGTGTDAAPYFRIFNPASQQERFDPAGEYIARWIPELGTSVYPAPMVDHSVERDEALERYRAATGR
jgi:deoxyribodipyrimidine photo-lyase